jgi:phage terminase large subunit GpA-like protein
MSKEEDALNASGSLEQRKLIRRMITSFAKAILPCDDLTITEWSDRYRALPRVSSSEQGQWRTSRFPFLKEIMDELSPVSSREMVVVQKGAQLGFTECALNWIFYTIDHSPCPIMYVQKTIDAVEKFSKQRFTPSLEVCKRVEEKVSPEKSRDTSNTIRLKSFPGGVLILGGANSAASLRSMPIERLILDEEESYDADIEEEGSPSGLAIRRTANFPRRKIFRLSTPSIKETSKIEPLYEEGDQRRYFVPCPFCGLEQEILWKNIRYEKDKDGEPVDIHFRCDGCDKAISERYKTQMLENGRWIAKYPGRRVASFFISSLYSPVGFFGWADAVRMWIQANREMDKSLLKVFVNTVLGETWSESGKTLEGSVLYRRREDYGDGTDCPDGVLVLAAGVDVQEDRVECEVVGYGSGQESWGIEYAVFRGDTEMSFVWDQLDMFLQKRFNHSSGAPLGIAVTAIDSGHRARVVYNFCKTRMHRRIFPIKGQFGWGRGLINRPKRKNDDGVYLFNVFVDEIKSKIYSQLGVSETGAGYCHFPRRQEYDEEYFKMLTAERLNVKRSHGQRVLQWDLPAGRRNEALDCRAYSIAALNILNPNFEALGGTPLVIRDKSVAPQRKVTRVHSQGAAW